jgi:hypothetical protein
MEIIVPHEEMVAERAGLSTLTGAVLRVPYREISLATKRLAPKVSKKIPIIPITVSNAEVDTWILLYVIRPKSLLVSVRKTAFLSAVGIRRVRPRPYLPSLSWITTSAANSFLKVLICKRQIGGDILLPVVDTFLSSR